MPDATDWIANIESHKAEIRDALTPADFKAFEDRCYALTDELAGGADPKKVAAGLRKLLRDYPPAAALVGLKVPAETAEASEPPPEGIPPGEPADPAAVSVAPAPPKPPISPPPAVPSRPISNQGVAPMSITPPNAQPPSAGLSKPENFILVFKEVVTAIIAVLIALTTLVTVLNLVPMLGDSDKMTQGKELLSVLTGLFGVVLGYYFGRVPADARAAQAQEQAAKATQQGEQAAAHSDMVSARAEELADQAKELVSQVQSGPTTRSAGAGGGPNINEELRNWADSVDELRRMARSR